MKNSVNPKFIQFIKKFRRQSGVTVRELAEAINKSPGYITQLEKGQIKTIYFDTAMAILAYLNDKSHLLAAESLPEGKVDEVLAEFLINNLEIYPPEYFEKMIEEQERREKERLQEFQRISDKLNRLQSIIGVEQEFILDFALHLSLIAEFLPYEEVSQLERDLNNILKKYRKED